MATKQPELAKLTRPRLYGRRCGSATASCRLERVMRGASSDAMRMLAYVMVGALRGAVNVRP